MRQVVADMAFPVLLLLHIWRKCCIIATALTDARPIRPAGQPDLNVAKPGTSGRSGGPGEAPPARSGGCGRRGQIPGQMLVRAASPQPTAGKQDVCGTRISCL